MLSEGILLGIGNPLLDIQIKIEDRRLLEKYNLKDNDSILAKKEHLDLFDEINNKTGVIYSPGGATQNALRVFQWLVRKPKCATFFGAIGNDKYGKILTEHANLAGVNCKYQINSNVKTGTCASLIFNEYRSLCADLAAANTFTKEHLEIEENCSLIAKAKYYYVSGFFLTVCPEAVLKISQQSSAESKCFMVNLAAPYICKDFIEPLNRVLPYVDIVFSNDDEANTYAYVNNFEANDIEEIALKLSNLEKVNKNRSRTVVITRGALPTIIATENEIKKFDVIKLDKAAIVDTNGAGDAFCGGFIAELVHGKSLEECVKCGNFAASTILQNDGCTFPNYHDYAL